MNRLDFNQEMHRLFAGFGADYPSPNRLDAFERAIGGASLDALKRAVDELLTAEKLPTPRKLTDTVRRHHARAAKRRDDAPDVPSWTQAQAATEWDKYRAIEVPLLQAMDRGEMTPRQAAEKLEDGVRGMHPYWLKQASYWASIWSAKGRGCKPDEYWTPKNMRGLTISEREWSSGKIGGADGR